MINMLISSLKPTDLAAILAVLCGVLLAGIITVICLYAKRSAKDKKMMNADVYVRILKDKTQNVSNKPSKKRGKGKRKAGREARANRASSGGEEK